MKDEELLWLCNYVIENYSSIDHMGKELELAVEVKSRIENQAVPEGWKLVPMEPTETMISRGVNEFQHTRYIGVDSRADWKACYRGMLAVAPTPPTSTERKDG